MKTLRNEDGEVVPNVCPRCGGDVVIKIKGEPVYLCNKCNKYFGTVSFPRKYGDTPIDETIRKFIRKEVRKALLKEENTINREIDEEANTVYEIITSHKYTKDEEIENNGNYLAYCVKFKRQFIGSTIDYTVNYFLFNDYKRHNLSCDSVVIDKNYGIININYDLECGALSLGDLHDSIQHELTHVFKWLKSFAKKRNYKPKARYIISAVTDFYNSDNPYEKAIGCVFYMGLNDEQDAYINGLYADIKENIPHNMFSGDFIKKSALYFKIVELINIRNNLDKYFSNNEFMAALEKFKKYSKYKNGLTKETFLKKIDYTLNRIKIKFLNMIKAYQKYLTRSGIAIRSDVISLIVGQFLNYR